MKYEINEKVYAINNGKLCKAIYLGSRLETATTGPQTTIITIHIPDSDLDVELEDRFVFPHPENEARSLFKSLLAFLNSFYDTINEMKGVAREEKITKKDGQTRIPLKMALITNRAMREIKTIDTVFMKLSHDFGDTLLAEIKDAVQLYEEYKDICTQTLFCYASGAYGTADLSPDAYEFLSAA